MKSTTDFKRLRVKGKRYILQSKKQVRGKMLSTFPDKRMNDFKYPMGLEEIR